MSDPSPSATAAVLVISDRDAGDGRTTRRTIPGSGVTVGAAPDCMISLAQARTPLAHHHARIARDEAGLFVLPEPGAPTFLNGADQPLPADIRRPVQPGDTLRMGSMLLRVQAPDAALPSFGPASALAGQAGLGVPSPGLLQQGPPDQARAEPDMLAGMLDEWNLGGTRAMEAAPPPAGPDALSAIVSDLRGAAPPPASPAEPPAEPEAAHPAFSAGPDATQAVLQALSAQAAPAPIAASIPSPAPTPSPAPRETLPADAGPGETHQVESWLPSRPGPGGDGSLAALAAFWWSLGCHPGVKDPAGLCQLMAELGGALRELVGGLETRLEAGGGGGQNALRRFIAARDGKGTEAEQDLALWVRQGFAQLDARQHRGLDEAMEAAHALAASLGAPAVEQRLRPLVRSSFTRSRKAELWDLFCKTSDDIGHTAELQFQRDLLRRRAGPATPDRTQDRTQDRTTDRTAGRAAKR